MKSRTFYVYVLVDPRDGSTFYVGKGLGLRMYQHLPEALKRREAGGNRRKIERILSIVDAGLEIIPRKVAEYEDEQEAFDHEADLIAATRGLTNILARGGGWAITQEEFERRQLERTARLDAKRSEKARGELRTWLARVDTWPGVTCYGVSDGDKVASEIVAAIRELVAA